MVGFFRRMLSTFHPRPHLQTPRRRLQHRQPRLRQRLPRLPQLTGGQALES